eukprot:876938-Rhodomonas_salina.1
MRFAEQQAEKLRAEMQATQLQTVCASAERAGSHAAERDGGEGREGRRPSKAQRESEVGQREYEVGQREHEVKECVKGRAVAESGQQARQ